MDISIQYQELQDQIDKIKAENIILRERLNASQRGLNTTKEHLRTAEEGLNVQKADNERLIRENEELEMKIEDIRLEYDRDDTGTPHPRRLVPILKEGSLVHDESESIASSSRSHVPQVVSEPPVLQASSSRVTPLLDSDRTPHAMSTVAISSLTEPLNSSVASSSTRKRRSIFEDSSSPKKFKIDPDNQDEIIASFRNKYAEFIQHTKLEDIKPEVKVTRAFVMGKLGGSPQATTTTGKKPGPYCGIELAFPKDDWNCVPLHIGDGGLIFAMRYDLDGDVRHLFVKDNSKTSSGTPQWKYLGQYQFITVGKLTAEESQKFPEKIMKERIQGVCKDGPQAIYVESRARIYLQKSGIPLTQDNIDNELSRIRKREGGAVSQRDVSDALKSGTERVNIIQMRCVGYDTQFAQCLQGWMSPTANSAASSTVNKRKMDNAKQESKPIVLKAEMTDPDHSFIPFSLRELDTKEPQIKTSEPPLQADSLDRSSRTRRPTARLRGDNPC